MLAALLAILSPIPLQEMEVVRAFDEQTLSAPLAPIEVPHRPLSYQLPFELTTEPVLVSKVSVPPLPSLEGVELPVTLNAQVLKYIEFFQGRGRSTFAAWYSRMGRYEEVIKPILDTHKVPQELIYQAMIESGFKNDAVSSASAVGLWQFVRGTGDSYGLRYDAWVDERRDFIASTNAAARHIKDLYERFESYHLALAAYNAGIGSVSRAIKRGNTTDLFTLYRLGHLQGAGGVYVPKIIAAVIISQDPSLFGFYDLKKEPPLRFEVVEVPGGLDLGTYARYAKVDRDELELLNPSLRRGYAPPDAGGYPLRVPPQAKERLEAKLKELELKQPQLFYEHRVRFGETLTDVAYRYGSSRRVIKQINELKSSRLEAGAVLLVPRNKRVKPRDPLEGTLLVAVNSPMNFERPDRQLVYFPVRQLTSIEQVASFFKVTPGEVTVWNSLDPVAQLQKGMALRLYIDKSFELSGALTASPEQVELVSAMTPEAEDALDYAQRRDERRIKQVKHTVRSGQTMRVIAKRYGVSPNDIRSENKLKRTSSIYAGLVLKIPVSNTPKPRGAAARALSKREARSHRVRAGDSLWKIAKRYGVSMSRLRAVNGLRGRVRLKLGQKLIIPRKARSRSRKRKNKRGRRR